MAQNVTLLGASYPDVPSVLLPKTGGGTAQFTDTSDTTATEADVAYGKSFYKANGSKAVGTALGGGTAIISVTQDIHGGDVYNIDIVNPTEKAVNFYDYDGTLLYAYTAQEALVLTELPANPTHAGLTSQGWNWTLQQIKDYLTYYPDAIISIGQHYITPDERTRIYITIPTDNYTVDLYYYQWYSQAVEIDWTGSDPGFSVYPIAGNSHLTHTYTQAGDYVIYMKVVSGSSVLGYTNNLLFGGDERNSYKQLILNKVEFGKKMGIAMKGLLGASNLKSLAIPKEYPEFRNSGLAYTHELKCVVVPSDVSYFDGYLFYYSTDLEHVCMPYSFTNITTITTYTFGQCTALRNLAIPHGITTLGQYLTNGSLSMRNTTIPSTVTTMNTYTYANNYNLRSIKIPSGVTEIYDNFLRGDRNLSHVEIPNTVTTIGESSLRDCKALTSITIPSSVTKIKANAFNGCSALGEVHIQCTTPPTLDNSNAFTNDGYQTIFVPYSEDHSVWLEYTMATSWADLIIDEEDPPST